MELIYFDPMNTSHGKLVGYALWLVGFTGSHRFYYGKPLTGTLWLCTGGLLGIGWLVDLFLIPSMERSADRRYVAGRVDYDLAWVLLAYLGTFGVHRFYMGKYLSGFLYLFTLGFLFIGVSYDFWTLNGQISEINRKGAAV